MTFEKPRRFSYAHILAEFYYRARRQGWDVWLDYAVRNKWGKKFKVSAVVVLEGEVVCAVWVRPSYNAARNTTRKRHRLDQLGIPVITVRQMERVPAAIEEAKTFIAAAGAQALAAELELP